jgi:hypothetical protein
MTCMKGILFVVYPVDWWQLLVLISSEKTGVSENGSISAFDRISDRWIQRDPFQQRDIGNTTHGSTHSSPTSDLGS